MYIVYLGLTDLIRNIVYCVYRLHVACVMNAELMVVRFITVFLVSSKVELIVDFIVRV